MNTSESLLQNSWSTFKELISHRWRIYGWYLLMSTLVAVVFYGAALWILLPLAGDFMTIFSRMAAENLQPSDMQFPDFSPFFLAALIALMGFLLQWLSQFGFYRVAVDFQSEQSVSQLVSRGVEKYFWTFFVRIAAGILLIGMLLVFHLLGAGLFSIPAIWWPIDSAFISFLFYVLGFFVIVVPSMYLLVSFIFTDLIVILENQGPVQAMKSSWGLVRGRWWNLFGCGLFWILISGITYMLSNFLIEFLSGSIFPVQDFDALGETVSRSLAGRDFAGAFASFTNAFDLTFVLVFILKSFLQAIFFIVPYYSFLALYLSLRSMGRDR